MDLTDNHSPALLLQVVIHFSLLFPFIFFILSFRSVLFSLKFFSNLLPPSLYSLLTVFPSFGQSLTARSLFPFHHHCLAIPVLPVLYLLSSTILFQDLFLRTYIPMLRSFGSNFFFLILLYLTESSLSSSFSLSLTYNSFYLSL